MPSIPPDRIEAWRTKLHATLDKLLDGAKALNVEYSAGVIRRVCLAHGAYESEPSGGFRLVIETNGGDGCVDGPAHVCDKASLINVQEVLHEIVKRVRSGPRMYDDSPLSTRTGRTRDHRTPEEDAP